MSDDPVIQRLGYELGAATANGAARRVALGMDLPARTPTSLVAYASGGSVVVIGDEERARAVAEIAAVA